MPSDLSALTKFFTTNPDELIALKKRVMGDWLLSSGQVDAIYCVGGTKDTQDQGLCIAAMYWHEHRMIPVVAALRGTTKYGYCGFEFCRDWLITHEVPLHNIVPIDILLEDQETLNTYTEGKALVHHARTHQWKTIIICAPYFHQIRASSTFISLLNQQNPELRIFNLSGHPEWMGRFKHSQGEVEGDLFELLISEFGRLFRYHTMGHIRSCAELLAYYDYRDKEFSPRVV